MRQDKHTGHMSTFAYRNNGKKKYTNHVAGLMWFIVQSETAPDILTGCATQVSIKVFLGPQTWNED